MLVPIYSHLNATMGSVFVARLAGSIDLRFEVA